MAIISEFNNRELSLIIWILIFCIWVTFQKKVRKSAFSLVKAFFAKKLVFGYLFMLFYIVLIVIPLYFFGIWNFSWIKNTLFWIICVAFVMLMQFQKANKEHFFKNTIKQNFKILVVVEFILNLYVFNFWIEMLIIPFSALLGGMIALSESDKQYTEARKALNFLLLIISLIFIVYAIYMIITNFSDFASESNLVDFVLPILLTIMFIPFIYFVALYSSYENLFIRMKFCIKDKNLLKYSKKKIFYSFKFNLKKVNAWTKDFSPFLIHRKSDIDDAIISFHKIYGTK